MVRSNLIWLLIVVGGCSSPSKPSQPVDQFPDGPKISCPAAPTPVISPGGGSTPVQYGAPTAAGGAPPVTFTCTPPSGSSFSVGTTTVSCVATDARQRTDSCTFPVVVQPTPRISITSFVAFGDSITAGEDGVSNLTVDSGFSRVMPRVLLPAPQRYPNVLESSLRARYTTQTPTVANAGLPGEKAGASTTLTRFNSVLSNGSYGAVLILEGSNDISERDAGEIPATIQGLRNMIQSARGRNVRPFLATIPPMVPNSQRGLAWSLVPALNSSIRNLAVSEGVSLVDVEAAFGTSYQQYIGADGLHPNAIGYAKIAETFFNILKNSLDIPASPVSAHRVISLRPG